MARFTTPTALGIGVALALSTVAVSPAFASPLTLTSEVSVAAAADASSDTLTVSDAFSRRSSNSWGTTPGGESWTTWGHVSVDGNRGLLRHGANSGAGARLEAVSLADQVSEIDLSIDKLPQSEMYLTFTQRHQGETGYDTTLVVRANGSVDVELRVRTAQGTTTLATHQMPARTLKGGERLRLRSQAVGQGTTELGASLWVIGKAEPAQWQVSATDATPELQQAGSLGLETWVAATKRTVTVAVDDWRTAALSVDPEAVAEPADEPTEDAPVAEPTPEPTPEPTEQPTENTPVDEPVEEAPVVAGPGPQTEVQSGGLTFVSEDFSRRLSGSWGSAPTGGSWQTWGSASVDGTRGVLAHTPSSGMGARLTSVSARDQLSTVVFSLDTLPTKEMYLTFAQRRVGSEQYETVLVVRPNGSVDVELRANSAAGTRTLGVHRTAQNTLVAGVPMVLRMQAVGQGSTQLGASLWAQGQAEPAGWQVAATDSTAALQQAGSVGLETWLGGSSVGVTLAVDSWHTTDQVRSAATQAQVEAEQAATQAAELAAKAGQFPQAPASRTGAGAAALGTTSYAIPADAIHVRTGASGTGSAANPLGSISAGVKAAKPGQTVVVHGGTYNEYVGVFNDPRWNTVKDGVTIQAAPGEQVWMDGTRPVKGWTRSGSVYVTSWTDHQNFNTVSGFGSRDETGDLQFHGPQNPVAADASQLFLGGRQLQQVAANPGPGQFAVERTTGAPARLILGEDPAGREVRASYLHQAIVSNANDVTIRGIGIRGYATPLNWMGTVYLEGARNTVENVVLDGLPTIPLAFNSANGVVRNVTSINAGLNGFGAFRADGARFENNYVFNANQQLFNPAPVAGGIKVAQMQDFTFTGNEIVGTQNATGLWVDESAVNFSIVDNLVQGSGSVGIHVEISACAIIAGNTVVDNVGHGIEVLGTPHTWIANNYVAGNGARGGANITVLQDDRRQADGGMGIDSRYPAPDPINTWITTQVHVVNNVLGTPHANALGQFDVHDRAGQSYADAMLAQVEGNVMVDLHPNTFARLGLPAHRSASYATLGEVERNHAGIWKGNLAPGTAMTQAQLTDLARSHRGVPMSPEVAHVLGLPVGTTVVGLP